MILCIRSILFDLFFYAFTTVYLVLFLPVALWGTRKSAFVLFRVWTRICLKMLAIIVGLHHTVRGRDHLDAARINSPCLIACKHQSAFDTIFISMFLDDIVIISKGQLASIPFFGYYLKKLGTIFIDRENKTSTIRDLLSKSRDAVASNRSLFIFPEGTRTKPGENIPYQRGISLLYRDLNIPVVPVALNTGTFWGRKSMFKRPGMIIIDIQPAIPAGLERDQFMDVLQTTINTASDRLLETTEKKEKKKWIKTCVIASFSLFLISGLSIYFGAKNFLDSKLHEAGIRFEKSTIHFGIHTLPAYELTHVKIKSSLIPESHISAQSVYLTATGIRKFTLEAKDINIQLYKAIFSTINQLEAYIVPRSKNASAFSIPYLRMQNTAVKIGSFDSMLNTIEGNYKQDSNDFDFAFYTPRPSPIDLPLLLTKGTVALKDNHVKGQIDIQTTFGDLFITALQQQGMITNEKAISLMTGLKRIEHESNPHLKQITIPIND